MRYARHFSTRRMILAGWLATTAAAAGAVATGFRIDNSVSVWFETTDPALAEYRRSLEDFGHREWVLVALERQASSVAVAAPAAAVDAAVMTDPAMAADRAELAGRLRALPDVHAVLTVADFPPGAPFVRRFLRPDPHSVDEAMLVQVTNDLERQDGYRERLTDELRGAGTGLRTIASVRVAGIAVINGELNRAARRDMFLFFPLVGVLLALVGAALFRNARDTAVLLAVAGGTVVITAGALIGLGHPLNMVTIMLPTVLIALSVADVVHLIHAFHTAHAAGVTAQAAARRAVRTIALPCLGTTLTTMAGFLAFAGSSVLPVFQLAVFGSFGIALAWVLTLTGGAALLVTLWDGRPRQQPPAFALGERLLDRCWMSIAARRPVVLAGFLAGGAALLGLGSLHADTDYVRFFRADTRVPREYRALQADGFPQNPLALVVVLPDTAALGSSWQALETFARELERLPDVASVLSPFALAPSPAALGSRGRELGMLSADGRRLQLTVMMDYPSSRRLLATLAEIRALAEHALPPGVRVVPTGTSLLWAHMDEGVIRTQRQSLAIVSVACLLILTVLFRSLPLGLLGLAVSVYPVAVVLGLMGVWGVPLNMATVLIAGVAVGLAVDDTIHLVHAWQTQRRLGVQPEPASRAALAQVGVRMATTSLILVGSFAVLGLSYFMPTSHFGLLSSLTVMLALAADLTLLPVLLAWRRPLPRAAADAVLQPSIHGRIL